MIDLRKAVDKLTEALERHCCGSPPKEGSGEGSGEGSEEESGRKKKKAAKKARRKKGGAKGKTARGGRGSLG